MTDVRRPEDRNSAEMFDAFPGGATLAGLEEFIARLRERGAPGDAHPRVRLSEDGEVTGMVCTVKRRPEVIALIEVGER